MLWLTATIQAISKTFTSYDLGLDVELEETIKAVFLDMETCEWGHRILVNMSEDEIMGFFSKVGQSLASYRVLKEHIISITQYCKGPHFSHANETLAQTVFLTSAIPSDVHCLAEYKTPNMDILHTVVRFGF